MKYDFIKQPGTAFSNNKTVFVIKAYYEQAKVTYDIGQIYDHEHAKIITDLLNQRAGDMEKDRLNKIMVEKNGIR